MWELDPCFSSPTHQGQVQSYYLLFSPLVLFSYQVLRGSIYSFPLVRYSCPCSACVLHALLCLKVYPNVSMERGILHVHLLLCHLVLPPSLLVNMPSRLVIAFLPMSKHLLISWLQSPSAVILEPPKIKSLTVSIVSPSICHEVMGPDAMILVF